MRLQPIAALCAVLLLVWGLVAVASVVGQAEINHTLDIWPRNANSWAAWSIILTLAAAVSGVPAVLLGAVGVRRRGALHLGGLVVLTSVGCTVVALVIDNVKLHLPWVHGTQSVWKNYRNGLTWHPIPAAYGLQRWWFFAEYLLLPLAVLVLVLWLVVLLTGAGRRASGAATPGYAYAVAPQDDYRYVIASEETEAPDEAPASYRDVPVTTEPRDAPAASGVPATDFEPAEVAHPDPVASAASAASSASPVPVASADAEDIPHVDQVRLAAQEADDARPGDDERVWFVTVQGADHGPYSRTQLRGFAEEGRLHDGTITHLDGGPDEALAHVLA